MISGQVPEYAHRDIFALIEKSTSLMEIGDFRKGDMRIMPRYSVPIANMWVRDRAKCANSGAVNNLVDSADFGRCCSSSMADVHTGIFIGMGDGELFATGFTRDQGCISPGRTPD